LKATVCKAILERMKRRPTLVAVLAPLALLAANAGFATAPVERAQGAFPGDNGRIAYAGGAIKTIKPDGTKRRRVTRPKESQLDGEPAFSPSGRRIAFVREFLGGPSRKERSRIFITRKNGSRLHKLKPRRRAQLRFHRAPAFSPGGNRVVFEGCSDRSRCALFTIKTDGTRRRRLTAFARGTEDISNPTFSPSGRMIAFDRYRSRACDIYVMRANGSDLHALTDNERSQCDTEPSFTPDGSEIAFTSFHRANPAFVRGQIYLMRADGTDVRPLTGSDDFGVIDFSFSPNGRRIVFAYVDSLDDFYGLWVMRADGTNQRKLVLGGSPDWGVR
jgi:Tol biopolymer transport system component